MYASLFHGDDDLAEAVLIDVCQDRRAYRGTAGVHLKRQADSVNTKNPPRRGCANDLKIYVTVKIAERDLAWAVRYRLLR